MENQRTLNPRVRGSSPWRRTRTDLVLYPFRSASWRPFRSHVCSTFARQSGPSPTGRPTWPRTLSRRAHSSATRRAATGQFGRLAVEDLLTHRAPDPATTVTYRTHVQAPVVDKRG